MSDRNISKAMAGLVSYRTGDINLTRMGVKAPARGVEAVSGRSYVP